MGRVLPFLLVALAVAAAAVAVNLVLLGYSGYGSDPVGKLRPVAPAVVPATPAPAPTPTVPSGERDD